MSTIPPISPSPKNTAIPPVTQTHPQVRVGTTGEGMFATWHLRSVEVVHIATGDRWTFNCHNWVDKKAGWCRVLAAVRQQ